jgi:hypothetical protein
MDKCIYHTSKLIKSKEVRADRQITGRTIQKCRHPDFKQAIFNKLECGGDLAKCQVEGYGKNA